MTIPRSGHNPFFRLMVNISYFCDFAIICALRLPTGCQQQVRHTKATSLRSSFHDDSNEWSQPILLTNGGTFCIFVILQTFARLGCRQAVSNRLDTKKSNQCDPHFMTIPMSGHNPYFRLTVNILYFLSLCNHLRD